MERIQAINADRIRWCCEDRGIAVDELAARAGVSGGALEKTLAGQPGLTYPQLKKLADFFNRGVLFFMEPGPVNVERIHSKQFRTITNQKPELDSKIKALVERVEKQREIYLGLLEELGEEPPAPFEPPVARGANVPQAAARTREWLGLGDANTFDSYRKAVEARGILVFRSNGYSGAWQIAKTNPICGFSLYESVCPIIVIKKQDSERRQVFTLFHELGHLLIERDSRIDDDDDLYSHEGKEQLANAFAGQLLVPPELLRKIDLRGMPSDVEAIDLWLKPFRDSWSVSGEVILRRLMDAGLLAQSQYQKYRKWKKEQKPVVREGGTREYRHREPNHVFGEPFVRTVLDALSANYITLPKASTFLDNLKIKDVHRLERYHAGV